MENFEEKILLQKKIIQNLISFKKNEKYFFFKQIFFSAFEKFKKINKNFFSKKKNYFQKIKNFNFSKYDEKDNRKFFIIKIMIKKISSLLKLKKNLYFIQNYQNLKKLEKKLKIIKNLKFEKDYIRDINFIKEFNIIINSTEKEIFFLNFFENEKKNFLNEIYKKQNFDTNLYNLALKNYCQNYLQIKEIKKNPFFHFSQNFYFGKFFFEQKNISFTFLLCFFIMICIINFFI